MDTVRRPRRVGQRADRWALGSLAAGAALRALWVFALHPPLDHAFSDMHGYVARASALASGAPLHRLDAFVPPGTHVLLAAPLAVFGTGRPGLWAGAALWWALSSLVPLLAWRLTRTLASPFVGATTAVLCAFSPLLVAYAGYFSSETPALALLLAALWLTAVVARGRPTLAVGVGLLAGALGGAAIATRPQYALNLLVGVLGPSRSRRARWSAVAVLGLGCAGVLAGALALNAAAAGRLTGVSENAGMIFFQGHCPVSVVSAGPPSNPHLVWGNPVAQQLGRGSFVSFPDHEYSDQAFFFSEGLACVRRDGPGHAVVLARNLLDATATSVPWPPAEEPGLVVAAAVANGVEAVVFVVAALGGVVLVRRRRRRSEPTAAPLTLLAHLACLAVVTVTFSSEPRYRIPYDVFAFGLIGMLIEERRRSSARDRR